MIAREDGTIVVRALQFVEELVVADLELAPGMAPLQAELAEGTVPAEFGQSGMIILRHYISDARHAPTELITPVVAKPLEAMAEVYLALVMGLRDYCSKNGIERVYPDCRAALTRHWWPLWHVMPGRRPCLRHL